MDLIRLSSRKPGNQTNVSNFCLKLLLKSFVQNNCVKQGLGAAGLNSRFKRPFKSVILINVQISQAFERDFDVLRTRMMSEKLTAES